MDGTMLFVDKDSVEVSEDLKPTQVVTFTQ